MSGPAAELMEYARAHNVVLSAWPAAGVGRQEYLSAIRVAGLKTAVYLARAARGTQPDAVEVFDVPAPTRVPTDMQHLPPLAYVFQIHSHQRPTGVEEGILYGDPVRQMLPTIVHPNEILDGAVIRGFMGRNATTYAIQNHAVIRALYAQHGETRWFTGVVLTRAQATKPERVRPATMVAGLVAHVLGADGAVFTKIGGGAPHVDMAQVAAQCEALGVKTTLIVEDMSTDGSQEGMLLFNFPGLDALVNIGSSRKQWRYPPWNRSSAPMICRPDNKARWRWARVVSPPAGGSASWRSRTFGKWPCCSSSSSAASTLPWRLRSNRQSSAPSEPCSSACASVR